MALRRPVDQQPVDLLLAHGVLVRPLAHVDPFRVLSSVVQKPGVHQAVIDHHVGLLESSQPLDGNQARVPRPPADQKNFALFGVHVGL